MYSATTDKAVGRVRPTGNTLIGHGLTMPEGRDTTRIGTGDIYLEILPSGEARIVGAQGDEAVEAVLKGVTLALQQNPKGPHYGRACSLVDEEGE